MRRPSLVTTAIVIFVSFACAQVGVKLDNQGLTSLSYNGWEFVSQNQWSGDLEVWGVTLKRAGGTTYNGSNTATGKSLDSAAKKVTLTFDWGSISCVFQPTGTQRINYTLTTSNTSGDTLTFLSAKVVNFSTPSATPACVFAASSWINCNDGVQSLAVYPQWFGTQHGPGACLVDLGAPGLLTMCNENSPTSNNYFGVPYTYNAPNVFPLLLRIEDRVAPGASGVCTASWRFSTGALSYDKLQQTASDIYMRYAAEIPYHCTWNDRRMIGRTFNAGMIAEGGSANNPRQWFNGAGTIDIRTTQGLENFRTAMLGRADDLIANMRTTNAQGVITWDIEGQQYGAITYCGDPDMIDSLAPEMVYKGSHPLCVVDEYFKKIRDAGFVPGICIRPQTIVRDSLGRWSQRDVADPGEEIYQDVTYARNRWGCRLYYMDSNCHPALGSPIPADKVIKKTLDAYPDIFIAGEWQATKYYSSSPAYDQWWSDDSVTITPRNVRLVYPGAFTVLFPQEGHRTDFIEAIKSGDIMICEMWYKPTGTLEAQQNYLDVGKRPYAAILSPAPGATVSSVPGIAIQAAANDSDGTIAKIEFYSGGVRLGETASGASFVWANAPEGKHSLVAKVIDNSGASTCSYPVGITVRSGTETSSGPASVRMGELRSAGAATVSIYRVDGRRVGRSENLTYVNSLPFQRLPVGVYFAVVRRGSSAIVRKIVPPGAVPRGVMVSGDVAGKR